MQSLTVYPKAAINFERLDEELRDQLGQQFYGLSYHHGELVVHLADRLDENPQSRVEAIIEAHDPAVFSQEQARQEQLSALREAQSPLNLSDAPDADAIMLHLLEKVAWLEAEMRHLLKLP